MITNKMRVSPLQLLQFLLFAVVVAFLFSAQNFMGSFFFFLASRIMILGLLAMSLSLLAGYGGLTSLAQASFAGIAGYTVAVGQVWHAWSFSQTVIVGLLLTVAVATLFAIFTVRSHGTYFFMLTLTFASLVHMSSLQWSEVTRGFSGVVGVPGPVIFGRMFSGTASVYQLIIVIVPLCYILMKRIVNSPFGIALQGVRDNRVKMMSLGFNVNLVRVMVVAISSIFAAIAGILTTTFYGMMAPDMVNVSAGLMVLFMALIGCVRRLEGAFIGAFVYVMFEDFISQYTLRYMSFIGIMFILIVLFMPNGVLGTPIIERLGRFISNLVSGKRSKKIQ